MVEKGTPRFASGRDRRAAYVYICLSRSNVEKSTGSESSRQRESSRRAGVRLGDIDTAKCNAICEQGFWLLNHYRYEDYILL